MVSSRSKFFLVSSSTLMVVALLLGAVVGRGASQDDGPYRHLGVFAEVLTRIKGEYVEEPEMKNVTLGALNGMLETIDPFASYLNAEQYKQYVKAKESPQGGVGVVVSKKYGYVGVVDVVPNSPAAKAGLDTNDMLETINGVSTRDMPLAFAELLLKGEAGTQVQLSVLRVGRSDPTKVTLTRAALQSPAATSQMVGDKTGYIQVGTLEKARLTEVTNAVAALTRQGAQRLVLDLRDNAVGELENGVALANLFQDKGLLGYVQGQKMPREDRQAQTGRQVTKLPLAVIVNRGTAGAAEIAAAALGDSSRAELVGEKTYGDAAVRRAIGMEDGAAVILSVAKYYSPSGKALQDTGVTPKNTIEAADVVAVPVTDEDDEEQPQQGLTQPKPKSTDDVFVRKAISVLTGTPMRAEKLPTRTATPAPPPAQGSPDVEKIITPQNKP